MMGGPAPVRRFPPDLMDRVLTGRIKPGKVFDLTLPIAVARNDYCLHTFSIVLIARRSSIARYPSATSR